MNSLDAIARRTNPLVALVRADHQSESLDARRVGFTLRVGYNEADVMISDQWRAAVGGIPLGGLLVAATFDPNQLSDTLKVDQRVLVLRVMGRTDIQQDGEHRRAMEQYFTENPDSQSGRLDKLDPVTAARMQLSGVRCKILGTFYLAEDGSLRLGSDIEDIFSARGMRVYKPAANALGMIVNFVDPIREKSMREEAQKNGVGEPKPFEVGAVRFASTTHMSIAAAEKPTPVMISPADFLSRRTAVFGMTRTGKSNTTKTMVSEVAITAHVTGQPIGQLIFDINGEYSNANAQDSGSAINDVFSDNTIRYRALEAQGFRDLRSNFYNDLSIALEVIREGFLAKNLNTGSDDIKTFLNFELPEEIPGDFSQGARREMKISILRSILHAAEYTPDSRNEREQSLIMGASVQAQVGLGSLRAGLALGTYAEVPPLPEGATKEDKEARNTAIEANVTLYESLKEAEQAEIVRNHFNLTPDQRKPQRLRGKLEAVTSFWRRVRAADRALGGHEDDDRGLRSSKGNAYLTGEDRSLLNVLVGKNKKDQTILTTNAIRNAGKEFHGPNGSSNLAAEVYQLLEEGRIVILDLSVGSPKVRDGLAEKLAAGLFHRSSDKFNRNERAPQIVVYVEEAHNLIGKRHEITDTWPRLAKEGAKFRISLVYATQEPSSIHEAIMAATENFFVTHLNNDKEIRALSDYYDFGDFKDQIKRAQDVGFARVKTLSALYVTPTQIKKFEPDLVKKRYEMEKEAAIARGATWFRPLNIGSDGATDAV